MLNIFLNFLLYLKNMKIEVKDIGPHLKADAESTGHKKGVDSSRIFSIHGTGMVMLTTLCKRYVDLGLICTDIEWVLDPASVSMVC